VVIDRPIFLPEAEGKLQIASAAGFSLLETYPGFWVGVVQRSVLDSFGNRLRSSDISFHTDSFDTVHTPSGPVNVLSAIPPPVPTALAFSESRPPNDWIVQFIGPVKTEWVVDLEASGLRILEYLDFHAVVVTGSAEAIAPIATAIGDSSSPIQAVLPYHPGLRLLPGTREVLDSPETLGVRLLFSSRTLADVAEAAQIVVSYGLSVCEGASRLGPRTSIGVCGEPLSIEALLFDSRVVSAEPRLPTADMDQRASEIVRGAVRTPADPPPTTSYSAFLASSCETCLSNLADIHVAVFDSGLDNLSGSSACIQWDDPLNPDPEKPNEAFDSQRIVQYTFPRYKFLDTVVPETDEKHGDCMGHGTMVAGMLGALDVPVVDRKGFSLGVGTAPGVGILAIKRKAQCYGTAQLCGSGIATPVDDSNINLPIEDQFTKWSTANHALTVPVMTNSWGTTSLPDPSDPQTSIAVRGAYTSLSSGWDIAARNHNSGVPSGTACSKPDSLLIVFAAGNVNRAIPTALSEDGIFDYCGTAPFNWDFATGIPGDTSTESAAKNVLAVGGTAGVRWLEDHANQNTSKYFAFESKWSWHGNAASSLAASGITSADRTRFSAVGTGSFETPTADAPGRRQLKPDLLAPATRVIAPFTRNCRYIKGCSYTRDDFDDNIEGVDETLSLENATPDSYRFTYTSGTSHAAPQVAGAAALLWRYLAHRSSSPTTGDDLIAGVDPTRGVNSPDVLKAAILLHARSLAGGRNSWVKIQTNPAETDSPTVNDELCARYGDETTNSLPADLTTVHLSLEAVDSWRPSWTLKTTRSHTSKLDYQQTNGNWISVYDTTGCALKTYVDLTSAQYKGPGNYRLTVTTCGPAIELTSFKIKTTASGTPEPYLSNPDAEQRLGQRPSIFQGWGGLNLGTIGPADLQQGLRDTARSEPAQIPETVGLFEDSVPRAVVNKWKLVGTSSPPADFKTLYYQPAPPATSGAPLRPIGISLAWLDATHADAISGPYLTNNLDLEVAVTDPAGTTKTYRGNCFDMSDAGGDGGYSAAGTGCAFDTYNNIEMVVLPPGRVPLGSVIAITVKGTNITADGIDSQGAAKQQDFGLYAYNVVPLGPPSISYVCSGSTSVHLFSSQPTSCTGCGWLISTAAGPVSTPEQNPVVDFGAAGTFSVQLNAVGGTVSKTITAGGAQPTCASVERVSSGSGDLFHGNAGSSFMASGTGFSATSEVWVLTPLCGGPISAEITARSLGSSTQQLTFNMPSACVSSAMVDVIVRNPGSCPEATNVRRIALTAPGEVVLDRPFGSTAGGTTVRAYSGGAPCDLTHATVQFGDRDGYPEGTLPTLTQIVVNTPASSVEGPVTMALGNATGCTFPSTFPRDAFEFVQYGFTIDQTAVVASMPLFRTKALQSPEFSADERTSIDGRPFPSVPIGAVSDVDVVTQAGAFLKRALLVERGRTVRLFSTASEALLDPAVGQFPAGSSPVCPTSPLGLAQDWAPRRVAIDPDGRYAYVLHRASDASLCTSVDPGGGIDAGTGQLRAGIPITILDLSKTPPVPADLDGDGEMKDARLPIFFSGWGLQPYGQAIDAAAKVTPITHCSDLDPYSPGGWRNAVGNDGTGWKRRFLVVSQSGPSSELLEQCPTFPPGCSPIGELWPPGCEPAHGHCTLCRPVPCDLLRTPLSIVVYDLNPLRVSTCRDIRADVDLTTESNPWYLRPRSVLLVDPDTNEDVQMGLDLAAGSDGADDRLYFVAPSSDRLLATDLSNLLNLTKNALPGDPGGSVVVDFDTAVPANQRVQFAPGALPTDAAVGNVYNAGQHVFVSLGGSNKIAAYSVPGLVPDLGDPKSIRPASGGTDSEIFPAAVAIRDQGDTLFSANSVDGSISPIPAQTMDMAGRFSVRIGSGVDRLAIQPEMRASSLAAHIELSIGSAPTEAFDSPAHQTALQGEAKGLETLIRKAQAAPNAVAAIAERVADRVDCWVWDVELARVLKTDLTDSVSLYRSERAAHH
jgi:hypothetical protein